jgi:hypothetical protein
VRRRLLVVASAALVVLTAAACGSSDKGDSSQASESAAWADGLCGALSTWKSSVASAGATVKNVDGLSKAKLEQAAGTVSDANAQLAVDVKSLGKPPKDAAPKAEAAVQDLSKKLRASADQIRSETKGVSSARDAVEAVSITSTALLSMADDVSATVDTLRSLDAAEGWKQAFADSKACRSLPKR